MISTIIGGPSRAGGRCCSALASRFALLLPALVYAEDYPTKTVRIIVPYPAGGATDIVARIMQEALLRKWNQPIVIENRSGASGNIGTEAAFKADPDGYTILINAPSPMTVNKSLYAKINFEPTEFVPVSILTVIPIGLMINPRKIPVNSLAEFIAYARAHPGKINAATQGTGTTSHLSSEWFQMKTGTKFLLVPYRGSALALPALIGGDVDIMFDNLTSSMPHVKDGRLKMLAVTTEQRLPDLPDMPTVAETLPGFTTSTWVGAFLPPKTPQWIADRLNTDLNAALKEPDVIKRFRDNGSEPLGTTPQAAAAFVRTELERWKSVIAATGIKPQ